MVCDMAFFSVTATVALSGPITGAGLMPRWETKLLRACLFSVGIWCAYFVGTFREHSPGCKMGEVGQYVSGSRWRVIQKLKTAIQSPWRSVHRELLSNHFAVSKMSCENHKSFAVTCIKN